MPVRAPSNFIAPGPPAIAVGTVPPPGAPTRSIATATAPAVTDHGPDMDFAFDVYARPFVPAALTRINTLPGLEFQTPPAKQINFGTYASRALPADLLPLIPDPAVSSGPGFGEADSIDPRSYEQFFARHLELEIEESKRENDSYALYDHEVTVALTEHSTYGVCTIAVPGLRENTPLVYEDDIVELRQLRHDSSGRLLGTPSGGLVVGNENQQDWMAWTGKIYFGRVTRVQLQLETLTVQVDGLQYHSAGVVMQHFTTDPIPLRFNVQFSAPRDRFLPMMHVLPVIQNALTEAKSMSTYGDASGSNDAGDVSYYWIQSMLFPIDTDCDIQEKLHSGVFANTFYDRELNWEQKKAVQSICSQDYGTLPYLVSGPPGTGKTKTLIEAALQLVLRVDTSTHILVCAPSDPAADTLAIRLRGHLGPRDMLRLNRPTRTYEEVPGEVLPYCYSERNMFCLPPFGDLMRYRVVVTTCRDAAMLMYSRMANTDLCAAEVGLRRRIHPLQPVETAKLHWGALIMDEAAQALEPEALIPLSVVAPPLTCPRLASVPLVVMAGDHFQLGPRTSLSRSPLKTSLFARLFARLVYALHPLARGSTGRAPPPLSRGMLPILRPAFTNLNRNYRSHPAILAIPSFLFYHDTLDCEAPLATQMRLAGWDGWKGRRWPILYHANQSRDEIEQEGGGWYNAGEADIACAYAQRLVRSGRVAPRDVCIMSPFKAQVRLLRRKMRSDQYGRLHDVNIGPTEAFQGLEKAVVILCTTRSKPRFVAKDVERDWGIVGLPSKMNVAMTRAQSGLVIIGKRDLLALDPHWAAVLAFCDRNGLVTGSHDDDPDSDGGAALADHNSVVPFPFPPTRLEKELLARGRRPATNERVLRGTIHTDEMWANGAHYPFLPYQQEN